MKRFVSKFLGPFLHFASRLFHSLHYHYLRDTLLSTLGKANTDLAIAYPWDIRGVRHVFIGADVYIGPSVLMIADEGAEIHIGDKVMFGPKVSLIASDHRYDDPERSIKDSGYGALETIRIGNGAWIGCGAIILKGVTIGDGAIIGAGSVVTKDVAPEEIWAGNPARRIKGRFQDQCRN